MVGKVYIVGAGPGDAELLTLKAYRVLQQADVVLYDRLVGKEIVEMLREMGKRLIYVGKRKGEVGSERQREINRLMKEFAEKGLTVVRLKGGDPMVFARVADEMEFLARNGIPFEIVPGISSVNGVAAYAGIPLTHREFGRAIIVVSGMDAGLVGGREDATYVVLMGGSTAREVALKLIASGLSPETPVAVIEKGTMKGQKITFSTLSELANRNFDFSSPAMLIAGKVVEFARTLKLLI